MKISKAFPSKYLKADDLEPKELYTFTIEEVKQEKIGDDEKLVVFFEEDGSKPLVLNRTNANTISMIAGDDDTDNWPGHTVSLYRTKTNMQGKMIDCIRIDDRPSATTPKPKAKAQAQPQRSQGKQAGTVQRLRSSAPVDDDSEGYTADKSDIPF